jgi:hypothetical protein
LILLLGLHYLGAFEKLGKATISSFMSVRQSATNNSARTGLIFLKFCTSVFSKNLSRKFKFHSNLTRIMSPLHENMCTFMTISRLILPEQWQNFQTKHVEKIKTYFMFNIFFSKTVTLMRYCRKIRYSQTGHRWLYNRAHAHCTLDNLAYKNFSEYVIHITFLRYNACKNVPLCFVTRTLTQLSSLARNQVKESGASPVESARTMLCFVSRERIYKTRCTSNSAALHFILYLHLSDSFPTKQVYAHNLETKVTTHTEYNSSHVTKVFSLVRRYENE